MCTDMNAHESHNIIEIQHLLWSTRTVMKTKLYDIATVSQSFRIFNSKTSGSEKEWVILVSSARILFWSILSATTITYT